MMRALLLAAAAGILTASVSAQEVVSVSTDTAVARGALVATDHDIAVDNQLGIIALEGLGSTPEAADVVAYGVDRDGSALIAFDTTVDLGGVFAARGDIVRWDGTVHSIALDVSAAGVPSGAVVDAVSLAPGGYLLSFDTTVDLGSGVVAEDADLVRWSPSGFSLAFDASSEGLADALDVDGAQDLASGDFLLSLDTNGTWSGVDFDDDDVLRFEGGVVSIEYDSSSAHPAAGSHDVDAVFVPEPSSAAGLAFGMSFLCVAAGRRRARTTLRGSRRASERA